MNKMLHQSSRGRVINRIHSFFASIETDAKPVRSRLPKDLEETIDASVAVLAGFTWLAAMTLLP